MKVTLVGFMGAGKTTIGKLLSERLRMPFLDLDELVVEKVGMSIPEIFKKKGENEFRKIESSILKLSLIHI
jgi:shikimate kinase